MKQRNDDSSEINTQYCMWLKNIEDKIKKGAIYFLIFNLVLFMTYAVLTATYAYYGNLSYGGLLAIAMASLILNVVYLALDLKESALKSKAKE